MIYFKRTRLMIPFSSFVIVLLAFIYPLTVDASDNTTQSITNNDPQVILQQTGEEDPYWTEEKMKNAIPADMDTMLDKKETSETPIPQLENHQIGENLSHPFPPEANDLSPYAVVPSTSGKVFFTKSDGKNYVCSGSAINNDYKNLVMTAAHCVHEGPGGGWHSNIRFAPAYYEGVSHYGLWEWRTVRTFNGWINNRNYDYDQAFFTVFPRDNRNLINTVGGNGLSYNYGQAQQNVRISGYPAEAPYDGELPYSCYGDTHKRLTNNDAYMNCNMTGGASGGPWFREMISENLGYVFAVTSRRSTSGVQRLYARPNTQAVKDMFDEMR
ncbi:hypothetical protein HXA34_06905 [Salipaludibacillus agaradhaerens]|uniref:trypsin-like serine peptidase n=2 Tax=Salipaludibacillus agaradhaerens TaxID=76935 RepID=UPI002151EB78|nr:hypothetical protein [Salipaludibacillus agaradhaerens]MCR6106006.1 hypothetical protein [Salipaludibacillus agaradhaerens]MCR6118039.1 hypothetical protein [Salipaludibacillus agaradhaerens]UJW57176.1 hypothetical protein HXZ66_07055 [Bacillus sp. A116_S68]